VTLKGELKSAIETNHNPEKMKDIAATKSWRMGTISQCSHLFKNAHFLNNQEMKAVIDLKQMLR